MKNKHLDDAMDLADLPPNTENPLAFATLLRDRDVVQTVSEAVKHKNFKLAFQTVYSIKDTTTALYVEGLARILDPTGRVIPAADFIDKVEETETGRIIDCLALEEGLATLSKCPDLRLAINMSARSVGYPRWNKILWRAIRADRTICRRLILEITEQSAMLVPELVAGFIRNMQKEGISFAIDDFGGTKTSFRNLRDLNFDILKIDGQFVRGISHDPDNQVVVAAMLAMAEQFGMLVVAENIETQDDLDFLRELGAELFQGYFLEAPTVKPKWLPNQDWQSA